MLMVAIPLAAGILRPDSPAAILREGRSLAPAPRAPRSAADWLALPAAVEAYLNDHFGLRQAMIRAHKDLTKSVLGLSSDAVMLGRDGRMFYLGEEAVTQSAGLVVRDQRAAETIADLQAVNRKLAASGVRFLVASPPNAATVYQDDLPDWAQRHGRRTEYDLIMQGLAAAGVKAVDLRPIMAAARDAGAAYYRHDTHWTPTRTGRRAARSPLSMRSSRPTAVRTGGSIRNRLSGRRRSSRAAISPECSGFRTMRARRPKRPLYRPYIRSS
jgi:hypothetical protein